jgi:hypothetical protein
MVSSILSSSWSQVDRKRLPWSGRRYRKARTAMRPITGGHVNILQPGLRLLGCVQCSCRFRTLFDRWTLRTE